MAMSRSALIILLFIHCAHFNQALVPEAELFPFGSHAGDSLLPTGDDIFAGPIQLQHQFQFFNNSYSSLFVNSDGAVSFVAGVRQYTPTCGAVSAGLSMIAPFWADTNNAQGLGGAVYYRESVDREARARASHEVQTAFPELWGISIDSVFITTWHQMPFSGANKCGWSNQTVPTNTFQLILATDGIHSFAIIYYSNMTWTTGLFSGGNCSGQGGAPAKAGFDVGDGRTFSVIPGSCTSDIAKISETSNIGKAGKWIFRVDNAITTVSCNSQLYKKQQLDISPSFTDLFGQFPISLRGPCFNESYSANCTFHDGSKLEQVPAQIIADGTEMPEAVCFVPHLYTQGRIQVDLTLQLDRDIQNYTGYIYAQGLNIGLQIKVALGSDDNLLLNLTWDQQRFDQNASLEFALYDLRGEWVEIGIIERDIPNTGHTVLSVSDEQLNVTAIGIGSLREPRDRVIIKPRRGREGGSHEASETHDPDPGDRHDGDPGKIHDGDQGKTHETDPEKTSWPDKMKKDLERIERIQKFLDGIDWNNIAGHEKEIQQKLTDSGLHEADFNDLEDSTMRAINDYLNGLKGVRKIIQDWGPAVSIIPMDWDWKDLVLEVAGKLFRGPIKRGLVNVLKWGKTIYDSAHNLCDEWLLIDPGPPKDALPSPPTLQLAQVDYRFKQTFTANDDRYQAYSQRSPSPSGASQMAGYLDGKLVNTGVLALQASRFSLFSASGFFNYLTHDLVPSLVCCRSLSRERCNKYHEHRPSNNGTGYKSPGAAHGCGDPHISTFDSATYTFNGVGEFWMIRETKHQFQMQVRIQSSGSQAMASVFTAFAMRQGNSVIQVQLSSSGTGIDVYLDGTLISPLSMRATSTIATPIATIEISQGKNQVGISFSSGCSFVFTRVDYSLTILSLADEKLLGTISGGLLGSYDGNPENDLETPDHVIVPLNSSLKQLHYDFGLKWMISRLESFFIYGRGKSYDTYKNEKLVPSFIEPDMATIPQHIMEMCYGEFECLYDYTTTNSTVLANQTRIINQGHKNILALFAKVAV